VDEEQTELANLLEYAVVRADNEEPQLLYLNGKPRRGLERPFAFRVGHHLQNMLCNSPNYSSSNLIVDMEYGKNIFGDKVYRTENGESFKAIPDLIFHQRGTNEHNILVVEFTCYWRDAVKNRDRRKLIAFTSAEQYNYMLGIHVLIHSETFTFVFFARGEQLPNPRTWPRQKHHTL